MVGLYETAIETLSCHTIDGQQVKPKIVASTATVRRATSQIRALFGRDQVEVFPPPGPDRKDSFFAETVSTQQQNARLYVGVSAQGRSLKVVLLRTYLALLGAAQKLWLAEKGAKNSQNPVDPYMTLVGYFNSLRELGGSRRIVEDEVRSRLNTYSNQKRETEIVGSFADRKIADDPLELTSRVNTSEVAEAKSRLEKPFIGEDRKKAVDVVLATNMISVGLDITRLGLMVVLGQPKTTAEYIQATSRVGRDENRPGLVITLMNIHRPRDRSHYERFQAWHNTFYRAVEATSVTPFSPRAIDRGLAGVSVALARLGCDQLTAPKQAVQIGQQRQQVKFVAEAISRRAEMHDKDRTIEDLEELRLHLQDAVINLFDDWENLARDKGKLQYQQEVGDGNPPLLYNPLDPELQKQSRTAQKFKAQRSLRDVEQSVSLWIQRPDGQDFGDES
jgi:Helicase conserved C-terminal domain